MARLICSLIAACSVGCGAGHGEMTNGGWRPLFDGATLAGWDRYLGKPSDGEPPLGLDNDPRGVFSVVTVDGEPAIRISGEVWGALISQEEFGAFDLRAEYKWGTLVGPSLPTADSGVMYLSTGPLGAVNAGGAALSDPPGDGAFMVSMEYQITPNDEGGVYDLGPITYQTISRTPTAAKVGWNTIEITLQAGESRHLLDGTTVAAASGFELAWPGEAVRPLERGKLQLESEGAEIYFRRIEIQPLP